jgi:hypothetical protein
MTQKEATLLVSLKTVNLFIPAGVTVVLTIAPFPRTSSFFIRQTMLGPVKLCLFDLLLARFLYRIRWIVRERKRPFGRV